MRTARYCYIEIEDGETFDLLVDGASGKALKMVYDINMVTHNASDNYISFTGRWGPEEMITGFMISVYLPASSNVDNTLVIMGEIKRYNMFNCKRNSKTITIKYEP